MPRLEAKKKLAGLKGLIKEAYDNGMVLREIARVHGVSAGTVRNALISQGATRRPQGRRRGVKVTKIAEETNNELFKQTV